MKKLLFFVILFATFGVSQAQQVQAQESTSASEWGKTSVVAQESSATILQPGGSYLDTCSNIKFDGSTLTATCKNDKQEDVEASLSGVNNDDYILNMNGNLVVAPKGSYTNTCRDIRLYDNGGSGLLLQAWCETTVAGENRYRGTSLEIQKDDYIINKNGELKVFNPSLSRYATDLAQKA